MQKTAEKLTSVPNRTDREGLANDSLDGLTDHQAVTYIYELTMALSQIAAARKQPFLSYLLEMAAVEGANLIGSKDL